MGKQTSNNHRSGGYFSINGALLLLLLVAVVLLSIVILVRFAPTSPVWCVPSRTLPDMDEEVSFRENIASSDNTALANMVGYIHYRNDTYLPLVLTKFDVDDDQLAFTGECATVTWKYGAQNGSSSVPEINLNSLSIGVPIRGAGSNQTRISHLCEIPEVFGTYYAHQRFSCLKRVSLSCLGEKDANGAREPVAELVLESFEIQLFVNATGNERKMKKHQFSIAQLEESCDIIQGVYYHRFHKDNKPDHKALDTD